MSPRDYNPPIAPTPATVQLAQNALHQLERVGAQFALFDRQSGTEIPLNEQTFALLRQLLIDLAQNRPVVIMPLSHEMTTHQAADFLNVSRGYLIRLLDAGDIPFRMVGSHRRIKLEDLRDYKAKDDAHRDEALKNLSNIEQDMGLK